VTVPTGTDISSRPDAHDVLVYRSRQLEEPGTASQLRDGHVAAKDCEAQRVLLGIPARLQNRLLKAIWSLTRSRAQLYGQQDRYVLSLRSAQFLGGYGVSSKVHIPPNDYSYSDTGMFHDDATGKR
jgi:hypothetical protein